MTEPEADAEALMLKTCENPPKVRVWATLETTMKALKLEPAEEPRSWCTGRAKARSPRGNRGCRESGAEDGGS